MHFCFLVALVAGVLTPNLIAHAATGIVTDCSAPGGAEGRLMDRIAAASPGDTIHFSCDGTITLAETIVVDKVLTLDGTGRTVTISGGDARRVLVVEPAAALTLNNLTLAHGHVTGEDGGGIYSRGTLTITNSTFLHNSVDIVDNSGGGGIYNDGGIASITNSTFSENSAVNAQSHSGGGGGGIYNAGGTVSIVNSTFSLNTSSYGGGICSNGATTVRNTIVANSAWNVNCFSWAGPIINGGNNIDSGPHGLCGWGSESGSMSQTDPLLGGLADNGGSTQTMVLLPGSPAIDGVTFEPGSLPSTDQRGVARPQGARGDIGSLEVDTTAPAVEAITRSDANPTIAASVDFAVTFSEAVTGVGAAGFTVTSTGTLSGAFVAGVAGGPVVYTVTANTGTGSGTLRLDIPASTTVTDLARNPPASLPYTGGETYDVRPYQTYLPLVVRN